MEWNNPNAEEFDKKHTIIEGKSLEKLNIPAKSEKIGEFILEFEKLIEKWKRFIKQDTYLTYEKKAAFLKGLENITQFPWYYPLRYFLTYKRIKKKKAIFKQRLTEYNESFIKRRLKEYVEFFDGKKFGIKYPLDKSQRTAIIRDDKHNLVVAGAGSGKTTVITSRIAYLIKRKDKVERDKILALAFTRVAAKEMEKRLSNIYNIDINISTFHALGRQILIDELNHIPDLVLKIRPIIQELFNKLMDKKDFQALFLDYVLYHSEEEIEEESFEDKQLYYRYMRNLKYSTLNNIEVKSISERNIGNFLFAHNIEFEYEPLVEWVDSTKTQDKRKKGKKRKKEKKAKGNKGVNGERGYQKESEFNVGEENEVEKTYHPDFYLPKYDLYIEHWGLNRQMKVPRWFGISSEEYNDIRDWKLKQYRKHGKNLIETWEYERNEGNLIGNLKKKLKKLKPNIIFSPLSYEELVRQTSEFERKRGDIFDLISSFIHIVKSNALTPEEISKRLKTENYSPKQKSFGNMALKVYKRYQKYLRTEQQIDFNDMINLAVKLIKKHSEKYQNKYSHILIDEFQDISYQRMQLIDCFVNEKSKTKLFCVGDDWQSIYQFTGSDVNFFVDFGAHFPHPQISYLEQNYRSTDNIVEMSNHLISHNKNQISKTVHSKTDLKQKEIVYFQFDRKILANNKISPPYIFKLIQKLLEEGAEPNEIMVLSRFNRNVYDIKVFCGAHGIPVEEYSPRGRTNGVRFYSAHKSKGSESKYVIITDLIKGTYGFPCEIQDSSVFEVAKRITEDNYIAEERRLFYVALTRAKQYLFLFSIQNKESMFIEEIEPFLQKILIQSEAVWERIIQDYLPHLKKGYSRNGPRFFCEQCGSILLETQGKYGTILKCSNYPECSYRFTIPENDAETCPRCGRKLVERRGRYGRFLGCTGYPECKYTRNLE